MPKAQLLDIDNSNKNVVAEVRVREGRIISLESELLQHWHIYKLDFINLSKRDQVLGK